MEFDRDAEVWIKFSYGKRAMGLRRKNDKCMFLDDNNRCRVYPSRPMTCRTFPYVIEYDDDGKVEVSLNDIVSCKCKKVADTDLNSVIGDTVTEDQEDGEYFDKIDEWNMQQKTGGTGDFLTWCKL
jgi:Fe-S-cluster containining protein